MKQNETVSDLNVVKIVNTLFRNMSLYWLWKCKKDEDLKRNFFLREIFRGNSNETISVAEIASFRFPRKTFLSTNGIEIGDKDKNDTKDDEN